MRTIRLRPITLAAFVLTGTIGGTTLSGDDASTAVAATNTTTERNCFEDEIRATFHAGPDGRMDSLCIHMELLSPAAQAQINKAATAWKREACAGELNVEDRGDGTVAVWGANGVLCAELAANPEVIER